MTNADLTISKSDSADPIKAGQQLTYSITVENKGPDAAQDVVITDQLPSATNFVSATGGCTNASGTVTCEIPSLANGASATRDIVVNTTAAGEITNTASVESDTVDFYLSNNTDREDTDVVTNRAPSASDDFFSTNEDTLLNVGVPGVLGGDSDPDGDTLTVGLPRPVSGPTHGTLVLNASGSFTYTPSANYNGTDSFTYKANDGTADSNVATVNIRVDPLNDAPTANPDSASVPKNSASGVDIEVLRNDTDPENDNLTVEIGSVSVLTGGGTATRSSDGKTINYKPATGFSGPATFEYRATDGTNISNLAVVTVTVLNNQSPNATTDSFVMNEGATLNPAAPGVLVNDSDPDGDPITAVLVSGPSKATGANFSLNANGSFTYTTDNPNFHGIDSFTYKANDVSLDSNVVTVNIRIDNVNDAPVADNDGDPANLGTPSNADRIQVAKNGTVDVDVLDNDSDIDGDTLTPTIITPPNNGTASVIGGNNKKIRYAPNAGFSGNDSLVYQVSDGNGGTDTATVFFRVAANGTPVAVSDSYETDEDTPLAISAPGVLDNDTDPDGDPITVNDANTSTAAIDPVSGPQNGTLALNADGSFTYTPNANFSGPDSFTYRATDGSGTSNLATVIISVKAVNDAPQANNDSSRTEKNTPVAIDVLGNDFDPDGDNLFLSLAGSQTTQTPNANIAVTGDKKLRYVPKSDFVGTDTFTYRVCDLPNATNLAANCDTATITVTVGDSGAPTVLRVVPKNGDQIVKNDANIEVTFSEKMRPLSLIRNILLFNEQGRRVPVAVSYDANNNKAIVNPGPNLTPGSTYKVVVKGHAPIHGPGVRDLAGNSMRGDHISIFAVNARPNITFFRPNDVLTVSGPDSRIKAVVTDRETQLRASNIKAFVDDRRVGFFYNPGNDIIVFRPHDFSKGVHVAKIQATDPQGLTSIRTFRFRVL